MLPIETVQSPRVPLFIAESADKALTLAERGLCAVGVDAGVERMLSSVYLKNRRVVIVADPERDVAPLVAAAHTLGASKVERIAPTVLQEFLTLRVVEGWLLSDLHAMPCERVRPKRKTRKRVTV